MRRLLPLALLFVVCGDAAAQTGAAQKKEAATAVARFDKALPGYSADVRKDADFLRGLLNDYYRHRDDLTASECEIAESLLGDLGLGEFGSRGEFSDLYAKSKPTAPPTKPAPKSAPKAAPKPKTHSGGGEFGAEYGKGGTKPTAPRPATRAAAVARRTAKISGLRSKPVFASGVNSLPAGEAVGYVTLAIDGKRRRIVEVPGTKALNPGRRAATIAARLRTVAAADSLWWMKLRVGTENGEAVLKVPGSGIGHILTADKAFAKEWGSSPTGLAARLRTKIRNAYDDLGADRFTTRGGDERDAAIEARQEGDELAAIDAEGAMARYRAAIEHDKTYLVPYLRIAARLRAQGKDGEANAILRQAAEAEGMSDEDKRSATAAIKG